MKLLLVATLLVVAYANNIPFDLKLDEHWENFKKQCNAGWAFSATGALEGQHKKKTGQLVSLSEQNLIDCSTGGGNYGCDSGFMETAFEYIRKNNGIDTEASYPYEAKGGTCRFKTSDVGATCTEWRGVTATEVELEYYVATIGPISATIDASLDSFQTYSSGIYNDMGCNRYGVLNHGVLVVGYGSEDGNYYWLVKNSWGTTWGMNGYIKMSKDRYNQCGIASLASYPIV